MTNMTFPALRLLSMEPAGRLASHAYPIKRVRKGPGKRGHTTKTCPVRSEVSRLRMSAPAGCCTTFQLHSRTGVARRETRISFAIVEREHERSPSSRCALHREIDDRRNSLMRSD